MLGTELCSCPSSHSFRYGTATADVEPSGLPRGSAWRSPTKPAPCHAADCRQFASVTIARSFSSAAKSNPLGAIPLDASQSVETSAYASLQYFSNHRSVIFFGLPQVMQVRDT